MKAFLCLVLVVLSFVSYFAMASKLSFYQYHPVAHYVGMAIGIFLLIMLVRKKFTKFRLVTLILSLGVVGFMLFYTMGISRYSNDKASIANGDSVGDQTRQITLVSTSGAEINFGETISDGKATLVVFSRAEW